MVVLLVAGSALPFLITFLIHYGQWDFWTHYPWLLTNPGVGMYAASAGTMNDLSVTAIFLGGWAAVVTVLNGIWFLRQLRRFRRYAGSTAKEAVPNILSATPMAATKTAF
jgi:hypothetical protein